MTLPPRPATTVEVDAHLAAACFLMRRSGGDALPVTADGGSREPIAVITAADIARAVAGGRTLEDTRIGEVLRAARG
jgi:CBS domain-containing protein